GHHAIALDVPEGRFTYAAPVRHFPSARPYAATAGLGLAQPEADFSLARVVDVLKGHAPPLLSGHLRSTFRPLPWPDIIRGGTLWICLRPVIVGRTMRSVSTVCAAGAGGFKCAISRNSSCRSCCSAPRPRSFCHWAMRRNPSRRLQSHQPQVW